MRSFVWLIAAIDDTALTMTILMLEAGDGNTYISAECTALEKHQVINEFQARVH